MTQDELVEKLKGIGIRQIVVDSEYYCEDGCCHDPAELTFYFESGESVSIEDDKLVSL